MNKLLLTAGIAIVVPFLSSSAGERSLLQAGVEAPQEVPWADGEYLLGTWGGMRTRLAEKGISFESYYVADPAGNPIGGHSRGFTYVDNSFLGITFDFEKLVGWKGGHFTISAVDREGGSLTSKFVRSRYDSQQVYGGQNLFLYQFVIDQRFRNDTISLKLGRFGASDDFNTSPIYGLYMNNGINGNIRNVLFDTQFSAYPFSTWASRLKVDITADFSAQFGVFQTWNDIFDRTHNGLNWGIRGSDGVILMTQWGWQRESRMALAPTETTQAVPADNKPLRASQAPKPHGMRGHYWLGASYSPWNGYSQFGRLEKTGNSYGFWAHADQMVYQEKPGAEEGLVLWAASGYYPQENISIVPFQFNLGGYYEGLIPGRDRDRTIFGLIYGRFSRDYAGVQQSLGVGDPHFECVLEAGYKFQWTKFASIQPDAQWIFRPNGGQYPDALVLGVQIGVTF